MNNTNNSNGDEAQQILEAMRKIQDSPELQGEAAQDPEGVMNRLGLSGVARHAIAFAITAALVVPGTAGSLVTPNGFWH